MSDGYSLIMRLRALGWALNLTRLNLIVLALTLVLLSVDQGQDLLLSMIEGGAFSVDDAFWKRLSLYGSTAIWGVSIWLWARVLLDIAFPDPPVPDDLMLGYRRHLPRILGVLAFFGVALNLYRAATEAAQYLHAGLVAIEGVAFWLAVIYRRRIGRWLAGNDPSHWAYVPELETGGVAPLHKSLVQAMGETRARIALAFLLIGLALCIAGMIGPVHVGQRVDTLLMLMLWSATVLPLGSLLTYWGNRKGIPVVIISLILIGGFSYLNDNHAIRTLQAFDADFTDNRPDLQEALDAWQTANCAQGDCRPFVVMATAGGGIRAAYWTATVLGSLHDRLASAAGAPNPLDRQLFAISGVSGGSVGATVYRTAIATGDDRPVLPVVQSVLGQDLLGPVSAGLLYRDIPQALLPVVLLADRAQAFEQGLESAFAAGLPDATTGLHDSFVASARLPQGPWPALLLNATWSDNGRRIVASTVKDVPGALYQDLLTTLGHDLRLSTAAHNSARFPLVSPPGRWRPVDACPGGDCDPPVEAQRLQDGGLFENFGAETALRLLESAREHFRAKDLPFRPLLLMVSSDPTLSDPPEAFLHNPPLRFLPDLRSTPHTLATVRVGRGAEAAGRFIQWARETGAPYAHFRMCGRDDGREPPLGWALSQTARRQIGDYLSDTDACTRHNLGQLEQVVARLR